MKDINRLVSRTWPSRWRQLGIELGLEPYMMSIIEHNHPNDCETCCSKMFIKWLNIDLNASWEMLIDVIDKLSEVDEDVLMANEVLCQRYTRSRFIPHEDDWPPYHPKHYTSLTIIHHEGKPTESEVTAIAHELSAKGSIVKKSFHRTNIYDGAVKSITEFFAIYEDRAPYPFTILVEGAPGIGKTILSKEIASQWASKTILKNIKLLFLLFMHDPQLKGITSIQLLVKYFCQDDTLASKITAWLVKTNGKYVTIVLDGYDEVSEQNKSHFINNDIIGRKVIPECSLVITSRPVASSHLHSSIDYRVEVLGFADEDRHDFIKVSLHDECDKIKALEEFLQSNPIINALCYIPLNMSILLCLAGEGIEGLPKTQTNLFRSFIIMAITHFLKRENVAVTTSISDLDDLPHPYDQLIKDLSRFAFLALQKDQLVFTLAELKAICSNMTPSDWYRFGLLKPVKYFKPQDGCDHESFYFLHFAIQEYMAAYHIVSLPNKTLERLLNDTFWEARYLNTWRMFVGITGGNCSAFKHFLSNNRSRIVTYVFGSSGISPKIIKDKIKCLHLLQCFSETKSEMLPCVENLFQNKIDLSNQSLSYNDVHTLAVLLLQSPNKQWEKLDISGCGIDDKSCSTLCEAFSHQTVTMHVEVVNVSGNNFHWESLSKLCSVLKMWQTKTLILSVDMLYDSSTANLIYATTDEIKRCIPTYSNTSIFSEEILCTYSAEQSCMAAVYSSTFCLVSHSFHKCQLNNLTENVIAFKQSSWKIAHVKFSYSIPKVCVSTLVSANFENITFYGRDMFSKGICDVVDKLITSSIFVSLDYHCYTSWNQLAADYLAGVVLHTPSKRSCLKMLSPPNAIDLENKLLRLNSLHLIKISIFDVSSNNIGSEMVDDLALLLKNAELESLLLSDNMLGAPGFNEVVKAMKTTSGLTTIGVRNISISNETANTLANILLRSYKLKFLDVSGNKLQSNGMCKIARALQNTCSLKCLDISDNNVGREAASEIATALSQNDNLQRLYMNNNNLQPQDFVIIAQSLLNKSTLTLFSVADNTIGDEAAGNIADILSHNTDLQYLVLSGNSIKTTGAIKIAKGLQNTVTLLTIDISNNDISSEAADNLAVVLSHNTMLQSINLGRNKFKTNGITKIAKSLQAISTLETIDFSANQIDQEAADDIANILLHNPQLKYLHIGYNVFQTAGVKKIAQSMKNISGLTFFNICNNYIKSEAVDDIAAVLSLNSELHYLNLSRNDLQTGGIVKIVRALENVSSLSAFVVSQNKINHDAADDIASFLSQNVELKYVLLDNNNLKTAGIIKIAIALQNIHSLTAIDISNNGISVEAAEDIAAILSCNNELQNLNLSGNDLRSAGAMNIFEALSHTPLLSVLDFSNNNINSDTADDIASVLSHSAKLQKLYLEDNVPPPVKLVKAYFPDINRMSVGKTTVSLPENNNNNLCCVSLSGNNLQAAGVVKVVCALSTATLRILNLSNNRISGKALDAIAAVLSCNTDLQELDLSGNNLQLAGITILKSSLHNISSLIKLNISGNSFGQEAAEGIASVLSHNTKLQNLSLGGNNIQTTGMTKIMSGLGSTSTLKLLNLSCAGIHSEGGDCIEVVLCHNVNLHHLTLDNNNLQPVGISKITRALSHNVIALTVFSIANTNAGVEAAGDIASALSCYVSLQSLNLSTNDLQSVGIVKIMKALRTTNLTLFDISNNNISSTGVNDIAVVLSRNNKLQWLNLCGNKFEETGIKKIERAIQNITTLREIFLSINTNSIEITQCVPYLNDHGQGYIYKSTLSITPNI